MKKTKIVTLVLITASLASCHNKKKHDWNQPNVYMRGDESAGYGRSHYGGNPFLWYYAFRPYGYYSHGSYHHTGYYSSAIPQSSNVGNSVTKSSVVRGGFGVGSSSVSS